MLLLHAVKKANYGDVSIFEAIRLDLEEKRASEGDKITNPELKQQVKEREIEGWDIEKIDNPNNRVTMISTKGGNIGGHAVTGFLTGLWTLGMGNVAYDRLSKKRNRERIVVSIDENRLTSKSDQNPYELLAQLKVLHNSGAITSNDFEKKKQEILDRI